MGSEAINFISFNSPNNFMMENHWIAMKKLSLWEIKLLDQSHTADKWQSQGWSNKALSTESNKILYSGKVSLI